MSPMIKTKLEVLTLRVKQEGRKVVNKQRKGFKQVWTQSSNLQEIFKEVSMKGEHSQDEEKLQGVKGDQKQGCNNSRSAKGNMLT